MSQKRVAAPSDRLKEAMGKMSQASLAQRSGIDKSSISLYLSGRYEPKSDKAFLLANALGVSLEWLMGFDAPKRGEKETVRAKAEENLDEYDKKIIEQLPNLSPDQKTALFTMIEAFHKGNQ